MERIAVCIPTCRRPHMLATCLKTVAGLEIPNDREVEVIVADNDDAASARALVEGLRPSFPRTLHYVVEPEQGLASIRNRLLREALAVKADWIAFLDDDEIPAAGWLATLAGAAAEYAADVVTGPVVQIREPDQMGSATGGRRQAAGTEPKFVATNNVMFRSTLVSEQGLWFDRYYDFIAGEDFDFFIRSKQQRNHHVWVPGAVVYELVPPERATLRYLFFRHFTGAINNVLRYRRTRGHLPAWGHFLLKLTGKLLGAPLFAAAATLTLNRETGRKAVKMLASGLGYGAGLCNIVVERYRDIDGN
jgi:succinoglycan biosynthesis protein ExoM